ncbi:LPXTG cell wall anchor domain-containing protein [Streptomyces sp. M2CJ-2]|uniref:LPXTG cell wall anchor domain-containing protein n=1 Tax=Streptomyces sp. M2CJ-2 TaxID=2803948 RepID=UPI0027DE9CA1|nr:LPXTG cell wall anchor domain-containing protein [Streptomyces sp. M2CJ-2]
MSSALRPLLTATAAGTLLCALWFVPSANATSDIPAGGTPSASPSPQVTEQARVVSSTSSISSASSAPAVSSATAVSSASSASSVSSGGVDTAGGQVRLADTGSFNSTPYVLGGTACLTLGAGFVVYSVRRERLDF